MSATLKALMTQEIERESDKDEKLKVIQRCLLTGNWDKCPKEFKLCAIGKLIVRGCWIVIHDSLQDQVVNLAHEGQQGIVKTKQRLRTVVTLFLELMQVMCNQLI